ncbi:cardiomyopathy-associated protein 5-like isoform X2 [Oncorhynchus keta]|uniref:cardiomyopathy-associated protein 5-like isoform X2 n=1 Tax=Oncorhynchus keta TaxID=8018 RepID=UPI00227CDB06|nr:cardiomyopathy-associated protein 5-like isoform X2 [Oncorhynchus keta]
MEISVVLEQNIGEYLEEISRSNEENKRLQSLLDLVFNSEIKLHREDSQQLSLPVSEEDLPHEQQQHCEQERSPSQGQEDPEPTQIKEEEEEVRTSQEEDQPQGLEPDTKDLLIPACVKSDYEQDPPLPSHLDQTLENRERDSLPTNTTEQIKTEPDGEDYSISEPTSDSQLLSEAQGGNIEECVDGMERPIPPPFSPDSQQPSLPVSKEEVPPEQQERSPRLGLEEPEPTKQEELWTNQGEQQLESDSRVSEPTSDSQLLSAVNPDCSAAQSENRVSEPTSDSQLLSAVNPDCSAAQSENRVSEPTSDSQLLSAVNPDCSAALSENRVSEPTSDSQLLSAVNPDCSAAQSENRVSEPTSDSQLLSAVNPDCSAALGENRVCVDGAVEMLILILLPPDSQQLPLPVSEEEVPPEQQHCEQERSPSQGQEDPEPTQIKEEQEELGTSQEEDQPQGLESEIRVLEPTSLCRVLEPTSLCKELESTSAVNPDCSAAKSEKIEEYVGGLERPILPSNPPELPVFEEEVPPEQQERSPSLQQEDPEPTKVKDKREEFRTRQEEEQLYIGLSESTSLCRVSDPTLSAANPDCSEAQGGNIEERVDGMERPIPPPFSPDSQQPSLPVSKEEVPPEQQERSPRLGLEEPEPTKQEELWTNQEEQQLESDSRVSEPTSDSQLLSAVNPDCSAAQSENRVSEPTSDSQLLSAVNPDCSAAQSENRVSEPTSDSQLLSAVNPDCSAAQSENRVSEPTSDSQLLSAVNPDCSAAQSENRVSEPTSDSQLLSAVNPDCSAAQSENRVSEPTSDSQLLSAVNPDCSAAQSENRVSEPTSDSQLLSAVNPDCSAAQSENRVSEPTSDSQLLSAVNPDCSASQSENGKVHQSPSTSSEQDSSNVESNEASSFSTWSEDNISVTDRNSSDSSSCTKEDSEARKPVKRTCHSSGVVNEPSDLSNLCDENNPGTEISPSDGNKDMNIQTDSGAHYPAKRICQRGQMTSPEVVCSRVTTPSAAPSSTHVIPMSVTDSRRSKKRCCRYCGKAYVKIARHLRIVHRDEVDEVKAFSFRKKSRERKVLSLLNKKGGFVRNAAVARRGSGEMASCSRPKVPGSTRRYTHCLHCQGLYIRKSLRKHIRYCPLNPKAEKPKPGPKMRIQSAMAFKMCPQPDYVSTGLWKIVCGMKSGRVSFVVRNDKCILLMGEELYNKLQPDDRRNRYIQQRMREVARLLITARTCTPLMCFEDLVIPSNLPHVITAVRAVAGYNEENKTYDRPTLAVQMGYNLMNIGRAVESCALTSGRHKVAESAGKFKSFKWNEVVLAGALSTLSEPQNKCPQPTPVTQAPGQPTCCTRTQPTPITQAPGQPTCCTGTQPTPITQAPGQPTCCTGTQPTPITQAPGQPTCCTRTQPTPVTQAPGQPTCCTGTQPTPITQAPGQPTCCTGTQATHRTGTQATRRTGTQPTRRTGTQPTRRTGTQPTRRTGTQPTRRTGTQATRSTGTQATRSTGTQATRSTGTQATRSTGTQATRRTGTQPTRRTGTQPTQRNPVRLKRIVDEGAAVEKHIMPFIKSGQVPGKRDCLKCLQSEPVALKSRNWSGIKFYVNRVKQRQSAAGNSEGSTPDLDSNSGPETGNPTP